MKISEKYNKEVSKELMKELGIKNVNAVPKIKKVLFVPVIIDERQNDLILFSENIF